MKIINELKDYSVRKESIEVKLQEQEIIYGNKTFKFELELIQKEMFIRRIGRYSFILKKTKNIESFENKMSQNRPWL